MRLICPNCEAQYEVADNAIPAGGRDVQCSNCGNTWYQMPLGANGAAPAGRTMTAAAKAPPAKAAPIAPVEPAKATETVAEKAKTTRRTKAADATPEVEVQSAPIEAPPQPEPEPKPEAPAPTIATSAPPPAADDIPPRKIDSGVLAVLREEAEREALRRKTEAEAAEAAAKAAAEAVAPKPAKPDLTVVPPLAQDVEPDTTDTAEGDDKHAPSSAVAKLQAAIATKPVEPEAKPAANKAATDAAIAAVLAASLGDDSQTANRQGKGRELLPDIEEIKSSLRSATDEGAEETDDAADDSESVARKRHGFRRGFISALALGLLLNVAYVSAPRIVAMVPALAGPMQSYVTSVDKARLYLDGLIRRATSSIEGES